ncbi:MAG: SCO family protein [Acidobacteria bacterium]|nr:SCO family protein [Acidobacteriota bacterium]
MAAAQPGSPGSYYGQQARGGTPSTEVPPPLREVTFRQRLDEQLPLDAVFRDETGRPVALREFFGARPVVLAFVYYQCPMLCSQVMNGLSSASKALPFAAGKDFEVVLISFDPRDTPVAAAAKKQDHLGKWPEGNAHAWHFLTGDEATIRRVTAAAGFTYRWDERSGQFAHVSGILVATPDGRLARYFYGVEYSPKELRLALVESGEGRVGSIVDELLLYCFHYDPESGRYGLLVMNLIRLGGVITVLFIGAYIVVTRLRESHAPPLGRA